MDPKSGPSTSSEKIEVGDLAFLQEGEQFICGTIRMIQDDKIQLRFDDQTEKWADISKVTKTGTAAGSQAEESAAAAAESSTKTPGRPVGRPRKVRETAAAAATSTKTNVSNGVKGSGEAVATASSSVNAEPKNGNEKHHGEKLCGEDESNGEATE